MQQSLLNFKRYGFLKKILGGVRILIFFKVKEINHYFFFAQPPLKFQRYVGFFFKDFKSFSRKKNNQYIFCHCVRYIASLWVHFMKPHMVITASSIFL